MELTLNAMEVTLNGAVTSISITRAELLTIVSAEELRHMLLVDTTAQKRVQDPLYAQYCHLSSEEQESSHRTISANHGPAFTFKQDTLLLGIGNIKAIAQKHRILVFRQDDDEAYVNNLRKSQTVPAEKFLLHCAEYALLTLIWRLDAAIADVRRVSDSVIEASGKKNAVRLRETELEKIRQQRLMLMRCTSQASDVATALMQTLDSSFADDNQDKEESKEWIRMFELYLQAYTQCSDECTSLLSSIEDFEESATLAMQARRLHIEEFELSLVIGALSVAAGGLIPGFMGMNLLNEMEQSHNAFISAILLTILLSTSLFISLRWLASCRGIFI